MKKVNSSLETVDQIITDGVSRGILHLTNEDKKLNGNKMHVKGREVINFGSCSYLGLEFDARLIQSSQNAVANFGTQFSESRAYVSLSLYREIESRFENIFGSPVIVTPTTTLGHIACIPVVVGENDCIILDHQVHSSVQNAVNLCKAKGIHVELLRHNRMDILEERIKELKNKYDKIWYMADGIYSMFGDTCPIEEIEILLGKHEQFHFYVDDAHGMSCFGNNGQGFVLSKMKIHDRMIVATSLAKAFATGGAVLIFPNKELARKVRTCGGPLITSGPLQPATLGAAIASADIHLSDEIVEMQDDLCDKIKYAKLLIKKLNLPIISDSLAPVFFIGVSLPKLGYKLIEAMLESGFYLNLGIFPAVPMKNTGIRFTITRLHTFNEIEKMLETLHFHFTKLMKEEEITLTSIYKAFRMEKKENLLNYNSISTESNLKVEIFHSINELDKLEWNSLMKERGSFDYDGMNFLEMSFCNNKLPENNWDFRYLIVRDENNQPILATFFTICLWKDDMLATHEVSVIVENKRKNDPYYMTSKVLMIGSLLTEGEHLFIDKNSSESKKAIIKFFEIINNLQEEFDVANTLIRDFKDGDDEMDRIFIDNGFFKISMPDNHIIENESHFSLEKYENSLSKKSRKHLRQDILKFVDKYEYSIVENPSEDEILHWYNLYLNVKDRSLELNTFTLPFEVFQNMAMNANWEISVLKIKSEFGGNGKPVAVMFNYVTDSISNFMLIGIDYDYQNEFNCYRQGLFKVITESFLNGKQKINLGFAASFEKKKLGATIIPTCGYMQTKDNYVIQVLNELKGQKEMVNN